MSPRVQTYLIVVDNFDPGRYVARSAGQARARAWREYQSCHECSFKHFLEISNCYAMGNTPPIGERIVVSGIAATHCGWQGQYVAFMRDGSDVILLSHPADVSFAVERASARGETDEATRKVEHPKSVTDTGRGRG